MGRKEYSAERDQGDGSYGKKRTSVGLDKIKG